MKYYVPYYFSQADQLLANRTQPIINDVRSAVNLLDKSFSSSLEKQLEENQNDEKIGILLSGGADSSLLVALLKRLTTKEIVCLTAMAEKDAPDVHPSKEVASVLGVKWTPCRISKQELSKRLELLLPLSKGGLYGTAGDLVLDVCLDQCRKQNINNLWTGNGLDMMFGGGVDPKRFSSASRTEYHKKFWSYSFELLRQRFYLQQNDTMNRLTSNYGVKLIMPFENIESIIAARSIWADILFKYGEDKYPVRLLAHRCGVPIHESKRPKDALQYSSGVIALLRDYMYEALPQLIIDQVNFKLTPEYFKNNPDTDLQLFLALLESKLQSQE